MPSDKVTILAEHSAEDYRKCVGAIEVEMHSMKEKTIIRSILLRIITEKYEDE